MTTQREAFEKWYDDGKPDALPKDYEILGKNYLWMGWQAAQQCGDQTAKINELEKKIVEYQEIVNGEGSKVSLVADLLIARADRDKLQKQNEVMYLALDELARLGNKPYYGNSIGNDIARKAISTVKGE